MKMILSEFVIDVESTVITSSRLDCDEFLKGTWSILITPAIIFLEDYCDSTILIPDLSNEKERQPPSFCQQNASLQLHEAQTTLSRKTAIWALLVLRFGKANQFAILNPIQI